MPATKFPARVWETSTTTGTGNIAMAGAVTGYRSFSNALAANSKVGYVIENVTTPGEWEVGEGTWSGTHLVRDRVFHSSNAGAAVNFGAGTKNVFVSPSSAALDELGNAVYVKANFGATGDGTTDDSTAIANAIAAIDTRRGQYLVFEPGTYLVPNGITESKQGLVVIGLGTTSQGPGQQGRSVGVVIKATAAGAWVWKKATSGATNDYFGGRFENLCFMGDADTAGGLRIEASYVTVQNCESHNNTTGVGFYVTTPASGDSAQVNKFIHCGSSDDLTGFKIDAGCNTILVGCYNLKYSVGGIGGTGIGCQILDSATQIIGGKFEGNDTGLKIESTGCLAVCQFEANATWDVDLARPSGTSATSNVVIAPTAGKIRIGANNYADTIIGNSSPHTVTDNGTDTVVIGNSRVKVSHSTATGAPSGTNALNGEVRVKNGNFYYRYNGSWYFLTGTPV